MYQRNFGSLFPDECIPTGTRRDIDNSVATLISQYQALIRAGDIVAAGALYNQNETILEPYTVTMPYLNRLEEEIYNLGQAVLGSQNTVVSDNEPDVEQLQYSYWLQPY